MQIAMAILFMTVGIFGLMVVAAILRGWALTVLWGWFVVPLFGLPALGVAQAIGFSVTVGLIVHQYVPSKDKDTWAPLATTFLTPLLAVLIGWIVKGWF